ncbi:MAG: response regulator [Oligoflexales bacterium]
MGHILIADDVKEMRDLLVQIVEALGYEALTAESGQSVLMQLEAEETDVDLVLLDIGMPGLNGIQVTKKIKENYPDIKICFVSGSKDKTMVASAIQAGGHDYVVKPVDIVILRQKIEKLLGRSQEDQFLSVEAYLKAALPKFPMDIPLVVIEISEVGFKLQSPLPFQKEGRLEIAIPKIQNKLAEEQLLPCQVDEVHQEKESGLYIHVCSFYGIHEAVRTVIRSMTLQGKKILDDD